MSWEAAAALGGGLLGGIGSILNNERNLTFQREAQEWNKWAQEKTWQREDSAVQRRVQDLKAAGLSPVLAAGSSAQAGSPTKIDPQNSQDGFGTEAMMSGMTRAAQTQQSIAAAEAARAQAFLTEVNVGKTFADIDKTNAMTDVLHKEFQLYGRPGGHPKYSDIWGKRIKDILEGGKSLAKPMQDLGKDAKKRLQGNIDMSGKTPAERAKASGKWHLFNTFGD